MNRVSLTSVNIFPRAGIRPFFVPGRRSRWWATVIGCWGALHLIAQAAGGAVHSGRILKVLPHLVDAQGRIALAPSLFQRDAYQAQLRQHPELVSSQQYDVNCQVAGRPSDTLKVRLLLRTALRAETDPIILEAPVKRGWFGRSWQSLKLDPATYRTAGNVVAWRAELLAGNAVIGAQNSFFW